MTKEELESAIDTTLADVSPIDGGDIASPSPVDLDTQSVSKNSTTKTVASQSISAEVVDAPLSASFSTVSISDEVTDESLNRTTKSLKDSLNTILSTTSTNLNNALGSQANSTTNALNSLASDINSQLSAIKLEADGNTDAINSSLADIVKGVNVALEDIRVKNSEQSTNVATQINGAMTQAQARDMVLKTALDEVINRVKNLDDVFGTDSDIATKIAQINEFISTLNGADLDIIDAIKGTIAEVNQMQRVEAKFITMNSASGTTPINLVANGFPEAVLPDDYIVNINTINAPYSDVVVDAKDEVGFDLIAFNLKTFGRVPQDCTVNNIKVAVTVVYKKLNPLTFDVDVLDDAFLTNGNGTDKVTNKNDI